MRCKARRNNLINLYINDLIVELSSKKIGCRIDDCNINNISYADDMLLLGPTFKYLGHYVTDDLRDHVDIERERERERRALAVRCNMLTRSLWAGYTLRTISAQRVQYNNGFRILMGLPRFCSASGMFAQAHVDGFQAIIKQNSASLL
ncbi:uncharacterized protein LOC111362434 [Spodoptera litura]|uniref:Uncharacterized protein LOC111362434 n=1 Tax=Spodoptera litura TaxID=69820 RepID=A0A9J7IZ72_SPOLT|nr:uncharacterized protein LOC111362434 [Spodoptera litura]